MIELRDVRKTYDTGRVRVDALRGITLSVGNGEFLEIKGPSGSGKSTLLNLVGLLDEPTTGTVLLDGEDVHSLPDRQKALRRNRTLGFVFQRFNLIPQMPAWKNVALPCAYGGVGRRERRARALAALERVGLADRADHLPAELSGGEEQRVAIARALVMHPTVILADEPTGNLDSASGREVLSQFATVHAEGTTIVVVTHDPLVDAYVQRRVHLRDGQFVDGDDCERRQTRPAESETRTYYLD
jgi:putative ABC transport system ATP-binding protein